MGTTAAESQSKRNRTTLHKVVNARSNTMELGGVQRRMACVGRVGGRLSVNALAGPLPQRAAC